MDTYKTDVAFDRIKRKFTLHLSGTPFKALANNKFADDAIYNWTYADEQKKKRDWDASAEEENPYATLPQLNLYTYQMSEIIKDELQQGIEINGETEEYAFDLNEFFAVTNGKFNHESSVDKFLDAMTRQTKFPFSTEKLRDELKHTFWLLDRVDSAKALAKKLKEHPIFKEYEIVLAAGDGKLDDDDETMKSYDKVVAAIAKHEKTITLSVGQLTTGITIPEWTAVETKKKEREKETIEDGVRDHLRGFSRTIPSFLMAYGDNTVTLATFDTIIPDKVFLEVTSITLDQFKFLRDGGDYVEEETGQTKHFDGQLFDSVVFDDSVKEFLALKKKLADYFDEKSVEDIFDYIPPQKTNQIFTPKTMVKKMVDMLEQENPGCFDMPDKTFIDLYMKSGLYITEIVKRLYQSDEMKKQFPDNKERLKHIFEKQVYGLAPTEIIYKIATSYILGFDEDTKDIKHNFRQLDALPYAKDGTLEEVLEELYPEQ